MCPGGFALPMNAMTPAQGVAVLVAACACVFDFRTHRIPNGLTFGAAAAAVAFHSTMNGFSGFATGVGGWLTGVAMLILPFALGGLGAGDVKLLGALGAWLGPSHAMWAGIFTTLSGGVMALFVAAASGYLREAWSNIGFILTSWRVLGVRPIPELTLASARGPRLAYAAPILLGTMVTIWLR
jgi:prepilin peptidase CpaA